MIPGRIPNFTRDVGKPIDWDDSKGECDSLPVIDTEWNGLPAMVSMWHPTEDDIEAIKEGSPIFLWVLGSTHPVIAMSVPALTYEEDENYEDEESE